MHESDEPMLVIGRYGSVELIMIDDIYRFEVLLFFVRPMLIDACCGACGLANIGFLVIGQNIDNGPIGDFVAAQIKLGNIDLRPRNERSLINKEVRAACGLLSRCGGANGNHEAVYFRELPRDSSTG